MRFNAKTNEFVLKDYKDGLRVLETLGLKITGREVSHFRSLFPEAYTKSSRAEGGKTVRAAMCAVGRLYAQEVPVSAFKNVDINPDLLERRKQEFQKGWVSLLERSLGSYLGHVGYLEQKKEESAARKASNSLGDKAEDYYDSIEVRVAEQEIQEVSNSRKTLTGECSPIFRLPEKKEPEVSKPQCVALVKRAESALVPYCARNPVSSVNYSASRQVQFILPILALATKKSFLAGSK